MKQTQLIMDMPVVIHIPGRVPQAVFTELFNYFHWVDDTFSTFKETSEISKINSGILHPKDISGEMREIFRLAAETKTESGGYFEIYRGGKLDPSGIVKGWAIHHAAALLHKKGIRNYYVEAGGDIEVSGVNDEGTPWKIGIRNPFYTREIIKVLELTGRGIATSGTYERGSHIYNPIENTEAEQLCSLTVIGPNILEADRFATAAFAMGKKGIGFIGSIYYLEGYAIDSRGTATFTRGFDRYVV